MGLTKAVVVSFIALAALGVIACAPSTEERIVVPEAYRGPVVVMFGDPDGVAPKVEGRRRTFAIPEDGVLLVRGEKPKRWTVSVFAGDVQIPMLEDEPAGDVLQAYEYRNGVLGSSATSSAVSFYTVIVGVPATDAVHELRKREYEMKQRGAAAVREHRGEK